MTLAEAIFKYVPKEELDDVISDIVEGDYEYQQLIDELEAEIKKLKEEN